MKEYTYVNEIDSIDKKVTVKYLFLTKTIVKNKYKLYI